jgi:hypothetical protein
MAIFADDFLDLMPATITVQTILDRDFDGPAVYASPAEYRARINTKTQNVINAAGQLVVARGCAWLDTVDPISINDRVIFPDGSEPKILVVNVDEDETGPAVTKLYFQ